MKRELWILFSVAFMGTSVSAQENYAQQDFVQGGYVQDGFAQDGYVGGEIQYGGEGQYSGDEGQFFGAGSVGSSEQLFTYDDQERWKHGYIKIMPYYHGFHSFRPYNYQHVFSQSTTAQGFGMSPVMPYSQQFWHRYEHMADLSQGNHEPVFPSAPPVKKDDHFPKPINEAALPSQPSAQLMSPYQNSTTTRPNLYSAAPQPRQNYSQVFQPVNQSAPVAPAPIAPAQYQNAIPYQGFAQPTQGPSLPAPNFRR